MVPSPGSGIPGAPAEGESAPNMEKHTPVLFLDLNGTSICSWPRFGLYHTLSFIKQKDMFILSMIEYLRFLFYFITKLKHLHKV